jgi:hypothetical protein
LMYHRYRTVLTFNSTVNPKFPRDFTAKVSKFGWQLHLL